MKIKAFLILGVTSAAIGQAYLWANNTSFTEQKDKLIEKASNYVNNKKDEAVNTVSNYVEDKKNQAIDATKQTIRDGFDKAANSIGINSNSKEKKESPPNKNNHDTSIKEGHKEVEQKEENKISWLYNINFKYDHQGSPDSLSEEKMLSLIQDASNIWEKSCGVKFNMIGNIHSDYIAVESNTTTNHDWGIIRWNNLEGNAVGQAHLGGTNGPAPGFILDIDQGFFNSFKGTVNDNKTMKTLLVHELGHVIGLEHSRIHDSIMYFQSHIKRTDLNKGDIEMCKNIVSQWEKRPSNKKFKI